MREWMNLLEGNEASMTPEQLEAEARGWEHACQNELASDFNWHFDPAFPLDKVAFEEGTPESRETWIEFMKDEIEMWKEEGQPDRFDDLLHEDIHTAIVLHIGSDGRGYVWDGCHRTGATAMKGLPTIAAIVGVRKTS